MSTGPPVQEYRSPQSAHIARPPYSLDPPREARPQLQLEVVHRDVIHDAVRAGEVDVLKDARVELPGDNLRRPLKCGEDGWDGALSSPTLGEKDGGFISFSVKTGMNVQ